MTYRAVITGMTASLRTEFGERYARTIFGNQLVDSLPRVTRGKNKGKLKGEIQWKKVERGGWVTEGPGEGNGRVENRRGQTIWAALGVREWGGEFQQIASMRLINGQRVVTSKAELDALGVQTTEGADTKRSQQIVNMVQAERRAKFPVLDDSNIEDALRWQEQRIAELQQVKS